MKADWETWTVDKRRLAAAANRSRIAAHDALCLPTIRECSQYRWSLADIAAELDRRGVAPPRKGGQWSAMAVLRIRKRHGILKG